MADTAKATLAKIAALLAEGKLTEAHALAASAEAAEPAPAGVSTSAPAEPAPPRKSEAILVDLLSAIVSHLGNHPKLLELVDELSLAIEE